MTGEELIREIERQSYYGKKEYEHMELVECTWFAFQIGVIACCLLSIAGHVRELWKAFGA